MHKIVGNFEIEVGRDVIYVKVFGIEICWTRSFGLAIKDKAIWGTF